jgi:hypothetical protein
MAQVNPYLRGPFHDANEATEINRRLDYEPEPKGHVLNEPADIPGRIPVALSFVGIECAGYDDIRKLFVRSWVEKPGGIHNNRTHPADRRVTRSTFPVGRDLSPDPRRLGVESFVQARKEMPQLQDAMDLEWLR